MAADVQALPSFTGHKTAGGKPSLFQHLAAVRRRLKPMLLTAACIGGVALLVAFLWPPTYRSIGTILIEQQEVPTDFVRSAVSSYADQRVQTISQRVMTSANLLGIIEKYNLYPDKRDTATRETLVDTIRNDIDLKMISADVVDPRQGRPTKATIAFSVSFDNRNPQTAARVANELTSLYLSENIESRKQLAADTAGFLRAESERMGKRVAELEQKLSEFKAKNSDKLPELYQVNMQMLDRSGQELREVESRIRALDQQILFLDAQLTQTSPTGMVVTENGERVLSPRDRLKLLRAQYATAAAQYKPDHPDVLRLKRTIEGLEAQLGQNGATQNDTRRALAAAQGELDVASKRYSPDHPDVKRLQQTVARLQEELKQSPAALPPPPDESADNPAYVSIRTQREAAMTERTALMTQAGQTRARIAELEQRQAQSPGVEREYTGLLRDLQGERAKYDELRQKEMEAQLVENLETERKGERFTLIEPPIQPEIPVSPKRMLIVLLGGVLAMGAAIGMMFLLESIDTRIRDRDHVIQLLGVPPLAIVPYVVTAEDQRQRRKTRAFIAAGAVAALAIVAVLIHLFVRPLDLVWYGILQKFGA
ncbi:MAG: lipopolysaccharide biosynthesis protein [Proteobacteria bacterium]|nr:lipopolysaccharide biosynthesis protein [Pseudomonadota bacterium]